VPKRDSQNRLWSHVTAGGEH